MKLLSKLTLTLTLSMALHANASNIWKPTDGDLQAIQIAFTSTTFAIFRASDGLGATEFLPLGGSSGNPFSDTINIETNDLGETIFFNSLGNSLNLGITPHFLFGAIVNPSSSTYVGETSVQLSENVWDLSFIDGTQSASLFAIDVSPVPEPSTILLMSLGLFGLYLLRNRNKA